LHGSLFSHRQLPQRGGYIKTPDLGSFTGLYIALHVGQAAYIRKVGARLSLVQVV